MNKKKILGIIPARGGSKGIPNKNIVELGGKPLIEYTIEAALSSKYLTHCIVSTDSEKIALVAKNSGATVPFMRPANLAADTTQSLPVVLHALKYMEKDNGFLYDAVVMLQPTTPLRRSKDIDNALELLFASNADSVISVVDVGANHPLRMKRIIDGRLINYVDQGHEDMRPRQDLPSVYIRNGAIYAVSRQTLMNNESFSGANSMAYEMPNHCSVNIDEMSDLILAEKYLEKL